VQLERANCAQHLRGLSDNLAADAIAWNHCYSHRENTNLQLPNPKALVIHDSALWELGVV
jgi:hypothetical protein